MRKPSAKGHKPAAGSGVGLLFAFCTLLTARSASSLDWGAEIAAGMLTTDNLLRTDSAPIDASVHEASSRFVARGMTRTIEVDAVGAVVYRNYDVSGISDDVLPTLNGVLQWTASPERFAWVVTENFGQRAINPNDGLLPPDRENVNILGTGPDMRLTLGSASWLTGAGRYSRINYEDSPFDSRRLAGRVGYESELDSGRLWSLNFSHARTEFSGAPEPFTIQTLSAGYVGTGSRSTLDANTGVTTLRDTTGSHTGYFADIRFEHQMSRSTELGLDLVHRFADAADVFRRRQDLEADIESTANVVASAQALRETAVNLSFAWMGRRTRAGSGVFYFNENFFQGDSMSVNRSGTGLFLLGEMTVRPTLRLESRLEWRREAPELDEAVRVGQGRFSVVWQFARTMGLNVGAEHYLRAGTNANDYEETRFFAQVAWSMRELDAQPMRPRIDTPASRRMNRPRQTL